MAFSISAEARLLSVLIDRDTEMPIEAHLLVAIRINDTKSKCA
jgi:hypothetical protein